MKKLLYVFLAVTVVFAMVACGNGSTDKATVTSVTVSPDKATVEVGKTEKFTATVAGEKSPAQTVTWTVEGGTASTIASDGTLTVAATETATALTVKATSTVDKSKSGTAAVTVFNPATDAVVTFRDGYTAGAAGVIKAITLQGAKTAAKAIGTEIPANPTRTSFTFAKWVVQGATENAAADPEVVVTAASTFSADATVIAVWTPEAEEPAGDPLDYVEKLYLENAGTAIFEFNLPEGAMWGDYEKLIVDYKVDATTLTQNTRTARLLGNYDKETDFIQDPNGAWIARYDASGPKATNKNAPYILDAIPGVGGWAPDWDKLTEDQTMPVADEWFTVTYLLDGSRKNSAFDATNLPAADATGSFYFGLGIAGGGNSKDGAALTNGNVQLIRHVTLVPYEDAEVDPVISVGSGFSGPAFGSYIDPVAFQWRFGGYDEATVAAKPVVIPSPPPSCACVDTGIADCDCDAWDCECAPAFGPAVPATADYTVDFTGVTVKNATSFGGETYKNGPFIEIPFPTQGSDQLDVRSYAKVSITAKFFDSSNNEITSPAANSGSIIWSTDGDSWYATKVYESYGLNEADGAGTPPSGGGYGTIDIPIPQGVLDVGPNFAGIVAQNRNAATCYIEITSITFYFEAD